MENEVNVTTDELELVIYEWASERGIYSHSSANAQLLKAMSEMGELADAEAKGSKSEKVDAVGDIVVCLINYAEMSGFTLNNALAAAYDEIKDRKGRMIEGGVFVKEDD